MGAGESILGASIGSGIAAGASTALGNSYIGNIASGVAGGIAGRAAGRAVANRLRNRNIGNQESQPLLGNRLGGRPGRNRLVPETPPQSSTMEILKKVMNKKIKNINDGINNISQQIRGKIKHHKKGLMHKYLVLMIMSQLVQHTQKFQILPLSNLNKYQKQTNKHITNTGN